MAITCSTKPLVNAVSQVVIDSNINKFFRKSGLIQITATFDTIRINAEANSIVSEATLHGVGTDADEVVTIFVDALQFKKLISTFTSDTVTLDFNNTALLIKSGRSKFTIPKMADESEVALNRPSDDIMGVDGVAISDEKWKSIKARQMFAVADGTEYPIYRYVWFGNNGEVLTGDYAKSLFTRSNNGDMPKSCLLPATIINLITNLPKTNTKLYSNGENFIVTYESDSYKFISEFTPKYESDEFGSYSADIILDICAYETDENKGIDINCEQISKFLNQIDILNTTPDTRLTIIVEGNECTMQSRTSEMKFEVKPQEFNYTVTFALDMVKAVIAKYSGTVKLYPYMVGDVINGAKISDGEVVTIFGGVED